MSHIKLTALILFIPVFFYAQQFQCDGKIYFFRTDSGQVFLSYVDNYITPTPVLGNVCNLTAMGVVNQNALAANPFDNYLYFMTLSNYNLYRIDANCNQTLICPALANSHRGCFDHLGRYWVIVGNDLKAFDITTCSMVKGPYTLASSPGADITFSLADCHLYMASESMLIKIDTNGTIVQSNTTGFGGGTGYGGIGIGVDGNLYGMPNIYDTIILYKIDLNTLAPAGVAASFSTSVANPCGCDMATFPCPVLNAAFTASPDSACAPSSVTFTDQSTGLVNSWLWDFGDGTYDSINLYPVHTYSQAGVYNVSLIVYAYSSCMYIKPDTFSMPISIFPLPEADFGHGTACAGNNVDLYDSTSQAQVVTWQWDFGDGSFGNVQHPVHFYTNQGAYNVSLIVISDKGCSDTITQVLDVKPLPVPGFLAPAACYGDTVFFQDTSQSNSFMPISTWQWQFGDGTSSVSGTPHHIYNQQGTYSVTLSVTNSNGCTDSTAIPVVVYPKPIADFGYTGMCDGQVLPFFDSSTVQQGAQINSWQWDFGDGGTGMGAQTTHLVFIMFNLLSQALMGAVIL